MGNATAAFSANHGMALADYESRSIVNGMFYLHSHTYNPTTSEYHVMESGTIEHLYRHWYMNERDWRQNGQAFPAMYLNFTSPFSSMTLHGSSLKYRSHFTDLMINSQSRWSVPTNVVRFYDDIPGT